MCIVNGEEYIIANGKEKENGNKMYIYIWVIEKDKKNGNKM